jgi:hypothetical protein
MTLKEALIAELDEVAVSDATIEKTLLDRSLTGTETYTATDDQKKGIDLCMIDILYRLLTRADIKEGSYSKSHNDFMNKIKSRLLLLASRHDVTEVLSQFGSPTINSSSPW